MSRASDDVDEHARAAMARSSPEPGAGGSSPIPSASAEDGRHSSAIRLAWATTLACAGWAAQLLVRGELGWMWVAMGWAIACASLALFGRKSLCLAPRSGRIDIPTSALILGCGAWTLASWIETGHLALWIAPALLAATAPLLTSTASVLAVLAWLVLGATASTYQRPDLEWVDTLSACALWCTAAGLSAGHLRALRERRVILERELARSRTTNAELISHCRTLEQRDEEQIQLLAETGRSLRSTVSNMLNAAELAELRLGSGPATSAFDTHARLAREAIDHLLEYSTLEMQLPRHSHEDIDVADLCVELCQTHAEHLQVRATSLRLTIDESAANSSLSADRRALQQLLANALREMVWHSQLVELRVDLSADKVRNHDAGRRDSTTLRITITGQRPAYATNSESSKTTAIGISIARRLTKRLGGEWYDYSGDGGQSTRTGHVIVLNLPAARHQPRFAKRDRRTQRSWGLIGAPESPSDAQPSPTPNEWNETDDRPIALIVDDNLTNRIVARKMLESRGFRVDEAASGREAVDMCASKRYGVVLMDLFMPGLDGHGATQEIRAREDDRDRDRGDAGTREGAPTSRVPIIAVTASRVPGERQRCIESGMDDFVVKPITQKGLEHAIEGAMATKVAS